MNLRTIRINDHIREMTNVFRHTMPKNIIFKLDLTEDDVMARIPPSQFDQILLNLALNSRDAMSEGGEIAISSSVVHHDSIEAVSLPELKPGIYVHVAVHDQGSGISPEILPKIFDPFFTTKKIGKGSGLGLSIVKTIVAEHNGHIQVESEKGKGTLVSFYLPAQMGTGADKKRKHVQEDRKQLSGTETILLADDEAVLTRCLARLFTRFGYQVVVADDGSKAFDLFNNSHSKIDLVVLDNEMPGLSGKQCMKKLLELAPRTRVILMSAHAMDKMSFDPIRDGAKAFLQKPFDIMDALKVVRRVLEETAISSPP
jgi:CheY-like chemotaxis protein